jgi:hypothetical protein
MRDHLPRVRESSAAMHERARALCSSE